MSINEGRLLKQVFVCEQTQHTLSFTTQRGHSVCARFIAAHDSPRIADFFCHLSAQSLFLRYFMPMPRCAPEFVAREAWRLSHADQMRHYVAAAFIHEQAVDQLIAVAELVATDMAVGIAELAVVVADAYQREGVGSALCTYLLDIAQQRGIGRIRADILPENTAIQHLLRKSGVAYTAEARQGLITLQLDLARSRRSAAL